MSFIIDNLSKRAKRHQQEGFSCFVLDFGSINGILSGRIKC
jgi:hypothetical protein